MAALGCSAPDGSGATDDDLLTRIVTDARPVLPKRAAPYLITRPVALPAGTTLRIEAGTHVVFRPASPITDVSGVFEAGGDRVSILVVDGEALIESRPPSPFLYAASAVGVDDFTVIGLRALDCQHVRVDGGPSPSGYRGIVTSGPTANVARRIVVRGGGARFGSRPHEGHAACLIRYAFDWAVEDAGYQNVLSGVEWWGGDANPVSGNGAAGNERKCGAFRIARVTAQDTAISAIWGSMGRDGTIEDCRALRCGDVGLDAEGSANIRFRRCEVTDAANGCFGTFFCNDTITFQDCTATVTRRELPLFRIHNPTLDMAHNRHITIQGGSWRCTDPAGPATLDTAGGPCAELTISDAVLDNAVIDTAHVGVHTTRITGNVLRLNRPFAGAAIRAGGSKTLGSPEGGHVLIADNRLGAAASVGTGVAWFEDDTISSASATISGNQMTGAIRVPIRVVNASPNPAVRPVADLSDNIFNDPSAQAVVVAEAAAPAGAGHPPQVLWRSGRTVAGRPIGAAAALGLDRRAPARPR